MTAEVAEQQEIQHYEASSVVDKGGEWAVATLQDTVPPSIQIDEFDESSVRLWKIFREAIQPLYFMILCWVNPTWDRGSNFKDYLESQGVNINEVKRNLSKDQRDKFMNPSSHNTWDISMIHVLLFFSICLAGKNDEKWQKQNGSDPEMSLAVLKDKRNETAHNPRIDRGWCSRIINELYELTIKIQGSLKLVVLGYVVIPEGKEEIEREMDRVFDNTRQKIHEIGKGGIGAEVFDEYQREIDFTKKKKLLEEEGFPCLKKILEKLKSINPLNLITGTSSNPNIPVEKIYTEMKLEGESGPCSVPIEDILNHVPHYDHSGLLLIKGMAGMGKTTLVKKINSDWLSKKDDIKGLNDYDILLYVQCRDFIESFKDLLVAFFRDVHQKFQGNEIIEVCLAYNCLLIIDGYDELNDKSSKLFLEVLTLKKSHPISVIVTTRPEFEERFNNQVKSDYTTVSTISLEGIPKEKREEFVCKYYTELGSDNSPLQSLEELLQYLRKTKHTMHEVWGLPLNLALVTVLWMIKPEVISNITTEAELYWQFHLLSLSKLKERLAKHPKTAFLEPTSTKIATKKFVEKLCGESFKALQNDEINIPESTINNLSAFCYSLGMPAEELTGAFLKKVTTSQGSFHYSFPHKGMMEFMAALFFPMKLTNHCWDQSVNTATVKKIFEMLLGGRLPENLHKYQNMMIHMISLFHVGDGDEMKVSEDAKIEALELLERSGVNDKDSGLRVLKNIKCDHSSSRWIAQRFKLFDKDTRIEDHTIDAYIALLRATDPPLPNREEIKIIIKLNDTDGLVELQRQLCRHLINPSWIDLHNHYKGDSEPTVEERESIKNLLTNDCEIYKGIWDPTFQIPPNIGSLDVIFKDHPSLDAFCRSLEKTKQILYFGK
ncbi:NACHT, LRR and PYD domains-containing protein 3-like [Palaemon carinicauda]|uniref:NACHT, LRR and PYD domains-containing protein 3-like n=1 Tax=Palaemon carinicauda TaxID=392227 RepID=UPI0035B60672